MSIERVSIEVVEMGDRKGSAGSARDACKSAGPLTVIPSWEAERPQPEALNRLGTSLARCSQRRCRPQLADASGYVIVKCLRRGEGLS